MAYLRYNLDGTLGKSGGALDVPHRRTSFFSSSSADSSPAGGSASAPSLATGYKRGGDGGSGGDGGDGGDSGSRPPSSSSTDNSVDNSTYVAAPWAGVAQRVSPLASTWTPGFQPISQRQRQDGKVFGVSQSALGVALLAAVGSAVLYWVMKD